MCNHTVLKNNSYGYVVQCESESCNYIQLAFGTFILSLTVDQFTELIEIAEALYRCHKLYPFPDQKAIQVPTVCRAVTMIFTVNELKNFINLLIEGGNQLQYKKLFVFNEN